MQQNNYNNNSQKSKIDFSHLIVGIDVAKNKQYARFCDNNIKELGKKVVFTRDKVGFNKLYLSINSMKIKYGKTKVLILMEPTGIYWRNIYEYFKNIDESIEVAVVDVKDVINVRKLFYPTVKSDTVDSIAIAKTALIKGFKKRLELTENEQELKDIITFKERLIKDSVALKNLITNVLDEVFPEYKEIYSNYFCKGSLVLLNIAFCPYLINEMSSEELESKIRKVVNGRCINDKKISKIKEIAEQSIGIKPSSSRVLHFKFDLERLENLLNEIEELDKKAIELMKDNKMFQSMIKIDGMKESSAANILSIIGSFEKFKNPKQLISYCGLNLRIKESGTHKGKTTISRNGNSTIRSYLFRVMLPMVKFNEEFKKQHNYNISRKINPLKPIQSIVALMCKLLRILWGMAKNNCEYNPEIAFKNAIAQAA